MDCLLAKSLVIFLFSLSLISSLVPLWSRKLTLNKFRSLKFVKTCFMSQHMVSSGNLEKEPVLCQYSVQWSMYINQVKLINSNCSDLLYPYWIFCLPVLLFLERVVLKTPTMIMDWFIYPLNSVKFLLFTFGAMLLDIYKFRIVTFLWIQPLIIIKCSYLSLMMILPLKSIFSDLSRTTPAHFGWYLQGVTFPILLFSTSLCPSI